MNNTFNIDSPYLEHYGVLGMKWGIRRYQNPDGSLTRLGRKRVRKAMKQHDVLMTTRYTSERDKEYKKFRDMVLNMYPAEVAELTMKVEQAERIRKLSDLKTEDKIEKGLNYMDKIASINASNVKTVQSLVSTTKNAISIADSIKRNSDNPKKDDMGPDSIINKGKLTPEELNKAIRDQMREETEKRVNKTGAKEIIKDLQHDIDHTVINTTSQGADLLSMDYRELRDNIIASPEYHSVKALRQGG